MPISLECRALLGLACLFPRFPLFFSTSIIRHSEPSADSADPVRLQFVVLGRSPERGRAALTKRTGTLDFQALGLGEFLDFFVLLFGAYGRDYDYGSKLKCFSRPKRPGRFVPC